MNSSGLNPKQLTSLLRSVKKMHTWLDQFTGRMHQRHFPHRDPLKTSGEDAFASVGKLMVEIERLCGEKSER